MKMEIKLLKSDPILDTVISTTHYRLDVLTTT